MQMGKLQNALDKSLANLPRLGIEKIIRDKLSAAGVEDEELVGQVAEVIAEGNTGHFTLKRPHDIAIDFTAADHARLKKAVDALVERVRGPDPQMANDQPGTPAEGPKPQCKPSDTTQEQQ